MCPFSSARLVVVLALDGLLDLRRANRDIRGITREVGDGVVDTESQAVGVGRDVRADGSEGEVAVDGVLLAINGKVLLVDVVGGGPELQVSTAIASLVGTALGRGGSGQAGEENSGEESELHFDIGRVF